MQKRMWWRVELGMMLWVIRRLTPAWVRSIRLTPTLVEGSPLVLRNNLWHHHFRRPMYPGIVMVGISTMVMATVRPPSMTTLASLKALAS